MDRKTILVATTVFALTFFVEEVRAFHLLKEFQRRFDEQNVLHASLAERIEMLEA